MERLRAWGRLGSGLVVLLMAVAAVMLAARFGLLWSNGVIDLQPWFHPIPGRGAWIAFIHPPGYAEFMYQVAAVSERFWVSEGHLVFLVSGVASAALILGVGLEVGARWGPGWAVYAGFLLLLSPATLRPFEQYPLGKALATAAVLLFLRWTRVGGRASAVASFMAAMAAFSLHLSTWFVVGPALLAGAVLARDRRRIALSFLGGLVLAFLVFGAVGTVTLYEVLASTNVSDNRLGEVGWVNLTYEWSNPWLWAPMALWWLPAVAEGRRDAAAVATGMAVFMVVHFALMHQAVIIGGDPISGHHYFELIDGLACFAAAAAFGAGWRGFGRGGRWGVGVFAVGLGADQVRRWLAGIAKLEQLAQFPG